MNTAHTFTTALFTAAYTSAWWTLNLTGPDDGRRIGAIAFVILGTVLVTIFTVSAVVGGWKTKDK